ncbi:hypothetical protein COI41_22675 [Bacillus toyonensis]|nr:hypothetical protein COI41_22675 [Bacillus toyonensis]
MHHCKRRQFYFRFSDVWYELLWLHVPLINHCFAKKRRQGHASSLISYMLSNSPTQKIFSSTNESNTNMQKVFKANGFMRSGIIENLDEGDPEIIFYIKKPRA